MVAEIRVPQKSLAILSLILSAAIFGFFYAWTVSTMWGLDQADPKVAIAAMQAMNANVRNAAFAPAFFGTAPMFLITALAAPRRPAIPSCRLDLRPCRDGSNHGHQRPDERSAGRDHDSRRPGPSR